MRRHALVALALGLTAGCGGTSHHAAPDTSTTGATSTVAPAYTRAQVYGWVSTTLANGISLVRSVPAGATEADLLPAASQLGTACAVSRHELTQTNWTGTSGTDERSLDATLTEVQRLVTQHPVGFGAPLKLDEQKVLDQLHALKSDLAR